MPSTSQRRSGLRRSYRPRVVVAVAVALAMFLAACASTSDDAGEDAPTTAPSRAETAESASPQALQDIWIVTRLQAVSSDGTVADVVVEALNALDALAGPPVELVPELVFRPLAGLDPSIITATGETRDTVEVIAGLLEVTENAKDLEVADDGVGTALAVIASAGDGAIHVTPGDHLSLDLFTLDPLADVGTVLVDYVFGQSLPPDARSEAEPEDPVELLRDRWADDRVVFGAPEDGADGDVALFRGIAMQRTEQATAAADATDAAPASTGEVGPGAITAGFHAVIHLAVHQQQGSPGGEGLVPIKASAPVAKEIAGAIACALIGAVVPPAGVVVSVVCIAISVVGLVGTLGDLLDENNDPPPPPPPPCYGSVARCTSSSGDPHLVGFGGLRYDVHAAGELTAVRSDDGQIDIQVRLVPAGSTVASNGAVAISAGDTRISVEAGREDPVWIDGEPANLGELEERSLPEGVSVRRHGSVVQVMWPDDTVMWVNLGRRSLDYRVSLGGDRDGDVTGLHGTVDGRRLLADGGELAEDADPDELRAFVDSWRITDATSLFDYSEGETTCTHTDLDFPAGPATLDRLDPDARRWAEAVCAAAGLAGDDLADCVLDVAATGDTAYAWSALEHQVLHHPDRFTRATDPAYRTGSAPDGEGRSSGVSTWETTRGPAHLLLDYSQAAMSFGSDQDGSLVALWEGSTLSGTWFSRGPTDVECASAYQGRSRHWGRAELVFDLEDGTFDGVWGNCDDEPTIPWSGTRIGR